MIVYHTYTYTYVYIFVVIIQSLSCVQLFVTPWTATHQASLSFTISWSLLKLMSMESVMLSNHLFLCHPLLLLPALFSSIKLFSNKSALHIGWASLVAQTVKHLPAMWETWVWSLSQEYPLEKEMATHSSILAWEIPWTDEPGGLPYLDLQESDTT